MPEEKTGTTPALRPDRKSYKAAWYQANKDKIKARRAANKDKAKADRVAGSS